MHVDDADALARSGIARYGRKMGEESIEPGNQNQSQDGEQRAKQDARPAG